MIIAIIPVFCLVTLGSLDSILSESSFEAGSLGSAVFPWIGPAGRSCGSGSGRLERW